MNTETEVILWYGTGFVDTHHRLQVGDDHHSLDDEVGDVLDCPKARARAKAILAATYPHLKVDVDALRWRWNGVMG